jgi:hypothetical protein
MTRWSAITRTRGRRSALAYGSRSTTAAEDNLNRLIHHERGRYSRRRALNRGFSESWISRLRHGCDSCAAAIIAFSAAAFRGYEVPLTGDAYRARLAAKRSFST